jgi:hypothetical protein
LRPVLRRLFVLVFEEQFQIRFVIKVVQGIGMDNRFDRFLDRGRGSNRLRGRFSILGRRRRGAG